MPLQILQILVQANETPLLEQSILTLKKLGFFQIVIPFVLFFAVIFAILEKSKLLGEDKRAVNAIVALVIALAATGAAAVTGIVSTMIPFVVLAIVVLLLFFLIYGLFGGELTQVAPGVKIGLGIAAGLAVALIFLYAANLFKYITGEVVGMFLLIAVIITVISIIVSVAPKKS
ncbi:hypothetical protein B6U80_02150 [Candidatus Pacearchaeota archaeon ex4484_26]|nr:MAG: hypothetical protein B6U80_02150 [Candidatus Pacearchaeota archaeon ex4484_26]